MADCISEPPHFPDNVLIIPTTEPVSVLGIRPSFQEIFIMALPKVFTHQDRLLTINV